ncbi:hypothetical protein HK104_008932, partial [Borealophlyctis nickersoniae]
GEVAAARQELELERWRSHSLGIEQRTVFIEDLQRRLAEDGAARSRLEGRVNDLQRRLEIALRDRRLMQAQHERVVSGLQHRLAEARVTGATDAAALRSVLFHLRRENSDLRSWSSPWFAGRGAGVGTTWVWGPGAACRGARIEVLDPDDDWEDESLAPAAESSGDLSFSPFSRSRASSLSSFSRPVPALSSPPPLPKKAEETRVDLPE